MKSSQPAHRTTRTPESGPELLTRASRLAAPPLTGSSATRSAYAAGGRTDDAIAAFDTSVAIRPNYGAAWYNLANLHARDGRYDRAIEIYDIALEHSPKLVPAWFNLGMVYRSQGDFARAQGAFATAVELAPGDGESQMAYADTLLSLGRNKEAIAAYDEILKELKLCLQECGRKLGTHIRKGKRLANEFKKRSYIETYIPHIGQALQEILHLSDPQTAKTVNCLTTVLEKSRKF